ncbi:hypothetical protein [Actinoplanes regularis]|uniref:hypothetical protein n=1 Tax=Actinoplanes regularis TaxID=52697 RepID=UPI001177F53B|nr:hypothetical protein [Actinoplanes regularis]GIE85475.1 hypothetical protein Are01nite_19550 [Actinoplanes regularis]
MNDYNPEPSEYGRSAISDGSIVARWARGSRQIQLPMSSVRRPPNGMYDTMNGVPFRPPPGRAEPDPRLDPYRERAGLLSAEGDDFGIIYLRIETCWWQTGGRLWWRRWSEPREQVHGYIVLTSGGFDDFVEDADTIADELDSWQDGRFPYRDEVLQVRWLDDEGSRHARVATFGLDEPET